MKRYAGGQQRCKERAVLTLQDVHVRQDFTYSGICTGICTGSAAFLSLFI